MRKEILQFDQVSYAYDEEHDALADCSVSLYAGEKVAVLGNNGAGKSTFFLLANGVLLPRTGTICLNDETVGSSSKERNRLRRSVGLVFQDPDVQILGGTVEEEISFGPMNLGLSVDDVRGRTERAIDSLQLDALRARAPQYLSGGEKKRVSIADVLAMEPQLMLLDEPAASLDPANSKLLENTLSMLESKGIALVVATHDIDFAWRWAERILVFCDGRLVADASPSEIFGNRELLLQCNLAQPTLYQVGQLLGMTPPRTIEQFSQQMTQRKEQVLI